MRFLNKLCSVEHTKCSTILQGASESARLTDFLLFSQAVFLFFATRLTVNMPHGNCLFCAALTALTFSSNLQDSMNVSLVLRWGVLHAVMKMFQRVLRQKLQGSSQEIRKIHQLRISNTLVCVEYKSYFLRYFLSTNSYDFYHSTRAKMHQF